MLDDLNVLKGGFKMGVNFEKRDTLIYVLILAVILSQNLMLY